MSKSQCFSISQISFKKIGILDSGIGGLTILKPLLKFFPAQYYYLADIKNLPYGSKSKKELFEISCYNIEFFLSCGIKVIIIACHTICTVVLNDLKKNYPDVLFIDVSQPIVQKTIAFSKNKKIGIIGTQATIQSNAYKKIFFETDPEIQLFEQACPNLASLIEELPKTTSAIKYELKKDLSIFDGTSIDTFILGCTHYEWIKKEIQKYINAKIISVETEIILYLKKKNFTTAITKSSVVCILSKIDASIKKRFNLLLKNLNVPFSIKILNQKFF